MLEGSSQDIVGSSSLPPSGEIGDGNVVADKVARKGVTGWSTEARLEENGR